MRWTSDSIDSDRDAGHGCARRIEGRRPLGTGIVTSNRPPKHATCFSWHEHAMAESRRSREALYFRGVFVAMEESRQSREALYFGAFSWMSR